MKRLIIALVILISGIVVGSLKVANAGYEEKSTGDVVVTNIDYPLRRHAFSFAAHEMGTEPFGKGFLTHQRLSSDGMEVLREEHSLILYVIVEGAEAWFAGPIGYDSNDPNPTRWFVLHVYDGGKPKDHNDWLSFARVADEDEALDILGEMTGDYTHEVVNGNLKIHTR